MKLKPKSGPKSAKQKRLLKHKFFFDGLVSKATSSKKGWFFYFQNEKDSTENKKNTTKMS